MKKLLFSALPLVLIAIGMLHLSAGSKTGAKFVDVSISATVSSNVNTGSYTVASFPMNDGDFLEKYFFNGKRVHSDASFTDGYGSILAKTQSNITLTGPNSATGTGTWKIMKGTGAYAEIKGSGNLVLEVTGIGTNNEQITQHWTGTIE